MGPKTDEEGVLEKIADAGMDVARLNLSHGTFSEQQRRIDSVKKLRTKTGKPIGIMLDTKGPEIRIGRFKNGSAELERGEKFTLCAYETEGSDEKVSVSYPIQKVTKKGDRVLLDDGLIELEVEALGERETICRVEAGGELKSGKSINLPGIELNMPYMTERDRMDIEFGVKNGVDFVAASFVRSAQDVRDLRRTILHYGGRGIEIISKIENMRGVENIDEIIEASDGIMVARGDMGVEIPIENIPEIQKRIIKKCLRKGKKCVTATQMLDSMIKNPRPTRAEVTDIANAIFDGTGAVMLSGETAAGDYAVESVRVMNRVAETAEKALIPAHHEEYGVAGAIAGAAASAAVTLGASAILTVTYSGHTANIVSKYRPPCPIVAVTRDEAKYYQMSLSWGVCPYLDKTEGGAETRFKKALEIAQSEGFDGTLIVTGGDERGMTNILKIVQ
ncbi:MAG: pyruvate kinase [Clostridia bacterium]|nr:pyruvate kinase [Clostridia bacterium]